MANYLILDDRDNVAVAIESLKQDLLIELPGDKTIKLNDEIPFAHKFAIKDVHEGETIIKQGEVIGLATKAIHCGDHVHIHNIKGAYIS
jgi:altronate dehydratase